MSGHSKWSTIKRKKGAADVKRAAEFTKLARFVEIAAKSGADPEMNFRLKLAVQKARAANMPLVNIERAIKKGSGTGADKSQTEEVLYEGSGPASIAVLVQALTDNKNRTVSELRNAFTKAGGSLGTSGSAAWQFDQKGMLVVPKNKAVDELALIEAGAEDLEDNGDEYEVFTDPKELNNVRQQIVDRHFEVTDSKLTMRPKSVVVLSDPVEARKALNFIDSLEEHDDVVEVWTNLDIPDDTMKILTETEE